MVVVFSAAGSNSSDKGTKVVQLCLHSSEAGSEGAADDQQEATLFNTCLTSCTGFSVTCR